MVVDTPLFTSMDVSFMILIQKYRKSTSSASSLAKELGLRIYTQKIKPKLKKITAINWGLSSIPWLSNEATVYNKPEAIKLASNKLLAFQSLKDVVPIPLFTTSKEEAATYFLTHDKVVIRSLLSASSGRGLSIAFNAEELIDAPLYVIYIPKKYEFRVHIWQGEVLHIQQKRRLTTVQLEERGILERNKYVRNLSNGYIFSKELDIKEGKIYDALLNCSIKTVETLGLDFGAVDLIVTKRGEVYVLEVNTAPGLEGETLTKYIDKIKELM